MRPNRGGKSVPPGRGGYDSAIVEVTGTPVYHMQLPPTKFRGPLIPAGDGGEHYSRPAPDLRARDKAAKKVSKEQLVIAVQRLVELVPPAERKALLVALLPAFGLGDAAGQIEALVAAR